MGAVISTCGKSSQWQRCLQLLKQTKVLRRARGAGIQEKATCYDYPVMNGGSELRSVWGMPHIFSNGEPFGARVSQPCNSYRHTMTYNDMQMM